MRFLRTQGFLASVVGVLAIAGCGGRGDFRTDLRPEGPPEVTAVIVQTDGDITDSAFIPGLGGLPEEIATFCNVPDPKKPTFVGAPEFSVVQFCPEGTDPTMDQVAEVDTASPTPGNQAIRIVFDELLNTDVETLIDSDTGGPCVLTGDMQSTTCDGSLATTQPVTLNCGGAQDVPYDGYYIPNGNLVSYMPGPALVIQPTDFIATSAECTVTIKDVVQDKDGNTVPPEQRGTGGAYKFKIAGLDIIGTSPGDGEDLANDAPVDITFNAPLDLTTVDAADISVHDDTANANVPLDFSGSDTADVIFLPNAGTWTIGDSYTVTVDPAATINDIRGGAYVGGGLTFTFNAVAP
jgi:hypothetical protein